MKKSFTILTLALASLVLVGCGKSTPTDSTPGAETSSTSVDSKTRAYNTMMDFKTYTRVARGVTVTQDEKEYYSLNATEIVDEKSGILRELRYERRLSDIDGSIVTTQTNTDVYEDGFYSYTLHDDQCYYKVQHQTTVAPYANPYDLSVLKDGVYGSEGYNTTILATLSEAQIDTFMKKDVSGVSDFIVKAVISSLALESLEYTYAQGDFRVRVTLQYSITEQTITLPTRLGN